MEDTVLYRDSTELFNPLESDKVTNVSSLSAFLATLNQSGSSNTRLRRFLDETGSLDVNVGDNNSCRLSDISSISYTNVTQDDNESLGCETNASLDNVIDSASSCRSDEESPYELDQEEGDYGLDSSGYFGNQDLFAERPLKVDKSNMTNLAPSDDDIKNFMSSTDSHADLYSGFSAEIERDLTKPLQNMDESLVKYAEHREANENIQAETHSNHIFVDSSNMDYRLKSPSFFQASSDESSTELKEMFVSRDFNDKVELKLNGVIGTKSAISNCKGSKVTLEFYCGKSVIRERIEKSVEVQNTFKGIKNNYKEECSNFYITEDVSNRNNLMSKPLKESECMIADLSHSKLNVAAKSQDEFNKVRIPTRIRPSPGLAKRIEGSKTETTSQDVKLFNKVPASNFDESLTDNKTSLISAKNDEANSQGLASSDSKTEEKKKPSATKALDFCNEDIESSLNEIRSILYGSRIGLAKTSSQNVNLNQSITSHVKIHSASNLIVNNVSQSADKESYLSNEKPSGSSGIHKNLVFSDEKSFCNDDDDDDYDENKNIKDSLADHPAIKAEVSVIDELLEELRMSEHSLEDDDDNNIPLVNSCGPEMKNELKCKPADVHPGRDAANLSVPYAIEKKTFSLSPEATDCDSIDASSLISDEEKTSPSAMPVVEDGLSSEDEGRDGLNEDLKGSNIRKSYRPEHIPRVQKQEDKFFLTSSSGSISNVSVSSSHSKQNGFPEKIKQVVRKDFIKPKMKNDLSEFSNAHLESSANMEVKVVIRNEKQDVLKTEVEKNSDEQDIIEMKKMSEIALFQSSTKGSLTQNASSGTSSLREDEEKVPQNKDQVLVRSDSSEGSMHKKLGCPDKDEESSEEGLTQKTSADSVQDLKSTPDEKKPNDATVAKSPSEDKARTKNYENERESFLIEGVLFRAQYLGSTQLVSEGQPSKATRLMQAQEAINRIKDPTLKGNPRPSTLVDLFVSVEKIMVLNTDLQEIMMDHALRTISYIADIGDVLVVMARRGPMNSQGAGESANQDQGASMSTSSHNQAKICCHVFESDEAQLIAQSISQAFQVAYIEFLKANGINDPDLIKEMDYQDVLSQQEIFGEELFLFSNRDMQKEVLVPKSKGEPLGMVIVESGWGSMVPTVVLANMAPVGAAARCGQLNIGDQIISVNGISLVGLPLSTCQAHLKALRAEILARFMVVSCTPVVEVLVKRPDIKYQLGFSVQNGVICSLLRGGIAERGGVRVGHRIIEINGQSVVAVPHDKIVSMLASSVGEIHMKTMQTSIYRLLTGQDTPHYI